MSTSLPGGESPAVNNHPLANRRRLVRVFLLLVVPLCVALVIGFFYLKGGRYVETDNAYVKADKIPISAEVPGAITRVLVDENQAVNAGDPLFQLDPAPYEVAVSRAQAHLAQVRTDLAALKASYREKQAEIAVSRSRHDFYLKEQKRLAGLLKENLVSESDYDSARQNTDLAALEIAALEQDLTRIAETLGGSVEAPIEEHPNFLAAEAELNQARLNLERTRVLAPASGNVSIPPKPGQYVNTGEPVMTLVASGKLWVEANFTETDLTYVRPGQSVDIHIDTYPGVTWEGKVQSLSPATSAEFSIIPAQNATGNWVKIAQRVPVRIALELPPEAPSLRAGLSAVTRIDTGHHRQLLGLSF